MTELEHFIKQKDVEIIARFCSVARAIKTKDEDCCEKSDCFDCNLWKNKDEILKILLSEHKEKPQLTDDEIALLKVAFNFGYRWIARDKGMPYCSFFLRKPIYDDNDKELFCEYAFNDMFKFIKWEDEEPWYIPDLLED